VEDLTKQGSDAPDDTEDEDDNDKDNNIHCSLQLTTRDKYNLVHPDHEDKIVGKVQLFDPAPEPQGRGNYKASDYAMVQGSKLELKKGADKIIFDKDAKWIRQEDWTPFDDDMTLQDLADLGEEKFLLWFQMIDPPKAKPVRKLTTTKKDSKPQARKKPRR
jgi:hypothetical protein